MKNPAQLGWDLGMWQFEERIAMCSLRLQTERTSVQVWLETGLMKGLVLVRRADKTQQGFWKFIID